MNSPTEKSRVVEPEILDEHGVPVTCRARAGARQTYRGAGFLTGFFALTFSFVFIVFGALISIFIIAPLLLLGRVLGLRIKSLRK